MHLRKPKLDLPSEIYAAIVREHGSDSLRLAQSLQSLGWSLVDAARAAVDWPLEWIAAAVATEKQRRGMKLHTFSPEALAALRVELAGSQPPADPGRPRKTPRVLYKLVLSPG